MQNHACASYLVLFAIRPLPHACLPLVSLPHLALPFSSTRFAVCISVPEPLPTYPFLLVTLKRPSPPLFQSIHLLDPDSRTTARLPSCIPSSHFTSLCVRASINFNSNVPILLAFIHQRKAVLSIYAIRSTDDVNCIILGWIHRFRRCSTLFNLARQTSRSAEPIAFSYTTSQANESFSPNHLVSWTLAF